MIDWCEFDTIILWLIFIHNVTFLKKPMNCVSPSTYRLYHKVWDNGAQGYGGRLFSLPTTQQKEGGYA